MASVFTPDQSQAELTRPGHDASDPGQAESSYIKNHSASPYTGMTSLGCIEGTLYNVEIFAAPNGPLFSVWGLDGQELATLMTLKQITLYFGDDLPLHDLQADSPIQLMHAEPIQADW